MSLSIETWTFYLAVLIAVFSGLTTATTSVGSVIVLRFNFFNLTPNEATRILYFTVIVGCVAAISFIFSSLLISGVKKKLLKYVKAYLVFSTGAAVLMFVGIVFSLYWIQLVDLALLCAIFVFCFSHSILMILAYKTYFKMSSRIRRTTQQQPILNQYLVVENNCKYL